MKELQTIITRYAAIDGTEFQSRDDCAAYEGSLPPHLIWCLTHKYTQAQLMHSGAWVIGVTRFTSREEYEPPAFLREGGYYTVSDSHDSVLGYAFGILSDVVQFAIETHHIDRKSNAFINEVELAIVSSATPTDQVKDEMTDLTGFDRESGQNGKGA